MVDVQPEDVPLPSNKSSMITVRLSDVQIHSEPFPDYPHETNISTPGSATEPFQE